MAKRFTDTNIWDKAWFRKLPPRLKETWRYLCDKCDHAGIWEIDIEALVFNVGESVTMEEIQSYFGDRVKPLDDEKIFLPSFIPFQYKCDPENLNPENKVHKSVIRILEKYGVCKPLASPLKGVKDKDKDKDKELDKDKESEKKSRILESLKEGMIQTWQYLEQFPEPELKQDAIEVITSLREVRGSAVEPGKTEIEMLINNWLFKGVEKDILLEMIKGAATNEIDKGNLTIEYILRPKHKERLLMKAEEATPKKRINKESEKVFRYPKNHGQVKI